MSTRVGGMLCVILLAALGVLILCWQPSATVFHENGSLRRPLNGADAWKTYGQPLLAFSLSSATLLCLVHLQANRNRPARTNFQPRGPLPWRWLLVIMLFSAGVRAPLLTSEMHRDEQETLAHHLLGRWKAMEAPGANVRRPPSEAMRNPLYVPPLEAQKRVLDLIDTPGRSKWHPVPWSETAMGNFIGNNSPLNSILARTSNRIWQFLSGSQLRLFHLTALRLPSFAAMTAAVAVLFLLTLWWSGSRNAALLAAVLFSLHPLVMRFGVLCRGYSLLLLFMLLALLAWTLALSRPQLWRWWYLAALSLTLAVLSFPGFALPAVLLTGVTLAVLARSQHPVPWLTALGASFAGLLTLLPWLGVTWIQAAFAASFDYPYHRETLDWLLRFLGGGLCGLIVPDAALLPGLDPTVPADLWSRVWQQMPTAAATLFLIVCWLAIVGFKAVWQVNRLGFCWLLALLSGAIITGVTAWHFAQRELLYWYAIYLAVLLPVSLACALVHQRRMQRLASAAFALGLLIGTFPYGQRGRLDLLPPQRFEILCSRFAGHFLVSDVRGRTLEVTIR